MLIARLHSVGASCFCSVAPASSCFLAFVQRPEHGVVSQVCVDWELRRVRWSGENDRENGRLEVSCRNVPIGKLDLAEVVLEAPPTLVAYKNDGRTTLLAVGERS